MAYSAASHGSSGRTQRLNALKLGGETSAAHQPSASSQRCRSSGSPRAGVGGSPDQQAGVRRDVAVRSAAPDARHLDHGLGGDLLGAGAGSVVSTPYHRRSQRCSDPPNLDSVLFCCWSPMPWTNRTPRS